MTKINKRLILLTVLLLTLILNSCDKNSYHPTERISILKEIPIFFCKKNQNKLIDDSEIVNEIKILNSKEDAESNFTKAFLESYPEYTQVDYSKYSVLVRTAPVDYNIINRKISLLFYKTSKIYQYQVDYLVGDICDVDDYYIERTAIIINKIPSNTRIEAGYSILKYVAPYQNSK